MKTTYGWLTVAISLFGMLLNGDGRVVSAAQLDQLNLYTPIIGSGSARLGESRAVGQTFRPAVSGTLARIELHSHINNRDVTPFQVEVSIVNTVGGAPSGAVLGMILYDWPSHDDWLSFDFESQAIQLQAENDYGIIIRSDDDLSSPITFGDEVSIMWTGNFYARGELWNYENGGPWQSFDAFGEPGDSDLVFKTFMVVPEPASLTMILLMIAQFAGLTRSRAV